MLYQAYNIREVAVKIPLEVSAVTGIDGRVFVGGKGGQLLTYAPGKQIHNVWEFSEVYKDFARRTVTQLSSVRVPSSDGSFLDLLCCLSDSQLTIHRSTKPYAIVGTLPPQGKNVATFCVYQGEVDVYIAVAILRSPQLLFYRWSSIAAKFEAICANLSCPWADCPSTMCWPTQDAIFVAASNVYHFVEILVTGDSASCSTKRLLDYTNTPPIILHLPAKNVMALLTRGSFITYTTMDGRRFTEWESLRFTGTPLAIACDHPYLIGLVNQASSSAAAKVCIEVRAYYPLPQIIHTLSLPRLQRIHVMAPGQVLVSNNADVWLLESASTLRDNVECLQRERHYLLAAALAEMSDRYSQKEKCDIKRQAAKNLFLRKEFDKAFELYHEAQTDVLTVLHLFPYLIGSTAADTPSLEFSDDERQRSLKSLSNYLRTIRLSTLNQLEKSTGSEEDRLKDAMQLIDTSLLKCYVETHNDFMMDPLLRLSSNHTFFDDARRILENANLKPQLFILYQTRGKHAEALKLLRDQFDASCRGETTHIVQPAEKTVEYLLALGPQHFALILEHAKWLLQYHPELGLQVFVGEDAFGDEDSFAMVGTNRRANVVVDSPARQLNHVAVAKFLEEHCASVLVPYLEYCVCEWDDRSDELNKLLLDTYVAKIKTLYAEYTHAFHDDEVREVAGREEGALGRYRHKLLRLLRTSTSYSHRVALLTIVPPVFVEERAVLLGQMGHHIRALFILTHRLASFEQAEHYCEAHYDASSETHSLVYLHWFRLYAAPHSVLQELEAECRSWTQHHASENVQLNVLDELRPNILNCCRVLRNYANRMDCQAALAMLPDDAALSHVAAAVCAVLAAVQQTATQATIEHAIVGTALRRAQIQHRIARSVRITVNTATECGVCRKKMGSSALVRLPDGRLAHVVCHNHAPRP